MKPSQQISILRQTYPFLKAQDLEQFLEICEYRMFPHKDILIHSGEYSKRLYFILEGMIRGYFINEKGQEKNIFLRPEHTIMGVADSLFEDRSSSYTIEVIGESHLLVFGYNELEALMEANFNLTKMMLASYQEMIQTLIYRVESFINKDPESRYDELIDRHPQFFQKAYHKHIANYLGITSVSLSRIIKRKLEK
ncbi:MAG: Crp/Fnr family transcriptional regulator [Bacteroidota bacterium]